MDSLIVRWVPNSEKGLAVSIYTTGVQLSGAFGIPFTAALCASAWQWPGVYYITGRQKIALITAKSAFSCFNNSKNSALLTTLYGSFIFSRFGHSLANNLLHNRPEFPFRIEVYHKVRVGLPRVYDWRDGCGQESKLLLG